MKQESTPVRVVLVTGSSGFLGQHVVKELHEDEHTSIREIRLFDNRPYVNKLGFPVSKHKATKEYVGDICDAVDLGAALSGVDAVIHCASIVDSRFFADCEKMELVNVQGTSNVVECCVSQGVPYLVYASSIAATPLVRRSWLYVPFSKYVGKYGETKARAEDIVATYNGQFLSSGRGRLRTLAIRIPPLYGAQDQIFITKCLRISSLTLSYVFCLDYEVKGMYAGNAAYFAVRGIEALAAPGMSDVSGKCLHAADETTDISLVLGPVAKARGLSMFPVKVPTWLLLAISCIFWGAAMLLSPLFKVDLDVVPSPMEIVFIRRCPPFDDKESVKKLHWEPKYSVHHAIKESLGYYRSLEV
ncbi:3 beta-hydroxysteroid dehydrogenase type 7-like isoform X1 [Rhipicephalus microplus]|uniref:3 beta-hydroxysteroid dehydrogenase type 7-like isoform X1 n=1 Tax=Rhipicephalus microplus TaxID=6941 RepID=UPI003F6A8B15